MSITVFLRRGMPHLMARASWGSRAPSSSKSLSRAPCRDTTHEVSQADVRVRGIMHDNNADINAGQHRRQHRRVLASFAVPGSHARSWVTCVCGKRSRFSACTVEGDSGMRGFVGVSFVVRKCYSPCFCSEGPRRAWCVRIKVTAKEGGVCRAPRRPPKC